MTTPPHDQSVRRVVLLGLPLQLLNRSSQQHETLRREFALIALDPQATDDVPARLVKMAREVTDRYQSFVASSDPEIQAAIASGETHRDISFEVPLSVRQPAVDFGRLLDEADEYCRRGDLLTLAMPAELVVFRQWYLTQFIDQLDGLPPTPWGQWAQEHGLTPEAAAW